MTRAQRSGISAPLLNAALFLVLASISFALILVKTHNHFTYCLDDPYIHLALAERIRHGLYGLNAGEPTSPSSSILWPLLFVPFAGTVPMAWLPLAINLVCGTATAWLLGTIPRETSGPSDKGPSGWRTYLMAVFLVVAFNLVGLAFTGLEHSLQVLLCVGCALAAVRVLRGERVPIWTLAAAILLPSIRYEGLLITVGLAIALAGARAWRPALGITLGSLIVPAGFSMFLHHLGLPWFPISVLVKSSYKFADHSSLPRRIAHLLVQTVKQSLFDLERLPQLIITIAMITLAWRYRRNRTPLFVFGAAAFVGVVQVVLGPVGWFYRYEIYALAFTLPVLIAAIALPERDHLGAGKLGSRTEVQKETSGIVAHSTRTAPNLVLAGVAGLALVYLKPLLSVPRAALGIYEQQYQLGRLTSTFYHQPVAVNDLGWVAFRRTANQYTLDLYGLGSYEVFRTPQKDRTPAWLDAITQEHRVGLVAIYPEWFQQGVPASWTPIAKLCSPDVDTSLGPVSRRVMIYRTPSGETRNIMRQLEQWRLGLPPGVFLRMEPADSMQDTSCHFE